MTTFLRRNNNGQLQPTANSVHPQFPSYTLGTGKGKGNIELIRGHKDTDGEKRHNSTLSLTFWHRNLTFKF
jgi:hypothetical protein